MAGSRAALVLFGLCRIINHNGMRYNPPSNFPHVHVFFQHESVSLSKFHALAIFLTVNWLCEQTKFLTLSLFSCVLWAMEQPFPHHHGYHLCLLKTFCASQTLLVLTLLLHHKLLLTSQVSHLQAYLTLHKA